MEPIEKIDVAIDSILHAAGTSLRNYSMVSSLDKMRDAMRSIMAESYILGHNEAVRLLDGGIK